MSLVANMLLLSLLAAPAFDTPPNVSRPSPNYAIRTLEGPGTTVEAHRGKVVVLAFIQTECPHCQRTTQMMQRLQASYGADLQILSVAINDDAKERLPKFIEKFAVTFPVGIDTKRSAANYLAIPETGLVLAPVLSLIDREGIIRAEYGGDSKLVDDEALIRSILDKLIATPSTQSASKP
jgi:peroxiredoxin